MLSHKGIGRKEILMLTWREFIALLLAGVWDFTQVGLLAATFGLASSQLSFAEDIVGFQPLVLCSGSVFVSILLAIFLKPHWALLPTFILENTPLIQYIPNTTVGTLYVIRSHRKSLEQGGR
jgi:hypothetical protein